MTTKAQPGARRGRWSNGYWLGQSEGFRVDSPDGRVGIVETVLGPADEPTALAVREGLYAAHTIVVLLEDVREIHPSAERIVLERAPVTT